MDIQKEDKAMFFLLQKMAMNMMDTEEKIKKERYEYNVRLDNILENKDREIKKLSDKCERQNADILQLRSMLYESSNKIKELEKTIKNSKENSR